MARLGVGPDGLASYAEPISATGSPVHAPWLPRSTELAAIAKNMRERCSKNQLAIVALLAQGKERHAICVTLRKSWANISGTLRTAAELAGAYYPDTCSATKIEYSVQVLVSAYPLVPIEKFGTSTHIAQITRAIGQRVRKERRKRGLTIDALAEAAQLSPKRIEQIESGNTLVIVDALEIYVIASVLDVGAGMLFPRRYHCI